MKKPSSAVLLGGTLALLSILIYSLQIIFFHNEHETRFLFMQDLAFLPLSVLIVTLVLERLLRDREKRERLRKLNIGISAFFSEAGTGYC